jgi:hypothetical protein
MDRKEFATFAAALRTFYPKEQLLPNQQAMELWYKQLEDIPYHIAETALQKWVATNKWSPSIAEIREAVTDISKERIPDWSEAWENVLKAVRTYGSYQPVEALESLDERTRACVRRIGFRNICMSENISVERANFRRIYEATAERDAQEMALPAPLKEKIAALFGSEQLMIGSDNND